VVDPFGNILGIMYDEWIEEVRELLTAEQLLYRITREELMDSYNEYVALIDTKIQSTERKKILSTLQKISLP
jgi:uncharacterized protein YktA (UPF0223 family)